jgi:phosphoglycerate kinase
MKFGVPELEDLPPVEGKKVLVRCDFNVPITRSDSGVSIDDDLRIRAALPTLNWLVERGAIVTACSHLGRPKGTPDAKYSMEPVAARLKELAPKVALLDNLRFNAGEEGNDPAFVSALIAAQDMYVDDAFGAAHRAHASIVGPPQFLPSAAGRLLAKEVEVLGALIDGPARPFVCVLGGSKVSDKLGVVEALLGKCDRLLIGGGMAYTFQAALGYPVGGSLFEPAMVDTCKRLLEQAGDKIMLPSDVTALTRGAKFGPDTANNTGEVRQLHRSIPDDFEGLDIGPGTAAEYSDVINEARTVFWNGPMGVFEDVRFEAGTRTVAQAMADTKAFTIVGGGDSAASLAKFKLDDEVSHVSTGGGASLEYLEQGDLPGLEALRNAAARMGLVK